MIAIENPSYYLKFNMNSSLHIVAINGFTISEEWSGDQDYSEYPINHHIKNGSNIFELVVGSDEDLADGLDAEFECRPEVRVRGTVDGLDVDYLVTNFDFDPTRGSDNRLDKSSPFGYFQFNANGVLKAEENQGFYVGEIKLGNTYYQGVGSTYTRTFEAIVPFPEWEYFSGESVVKYPFSDDEYLKYEAMIQVEIEKAYQLFETRDVDKILPHFELRSREIDQAFYKEPGSTQDDMRRSLEGVFGRNLPWYEISDDNFQFVSSFDGRLLTRVDAGNMAGTIYFKDEETGSSTFYTIYWMKKDGEWIIAR